MRSALVLAAREMLPSTQWTASALGTVLISTLDSSALVVPFRRFPAPSRER